MTVFQIMAKPKINAMVVFVANFKTPESPVAVHCSIPPHPNRAMQVSCELNDQWSLMGAVQCGNSTGRAESAGLGEKQGSLSLYGITYGPERFSFRTKKGAGA
ncbi:hypothetical protein TMES_06070 [Thalassospira mesophila]|uniref:Uncharacterized protein n=1 Tax=Thalassospira mesophila TaxID=1293891 RepID=A0A1Y2L2K8_9PROT|nr:hypothetical protein TMES_06070 [Thalassospira mesophila]